MSSESLRGRVAAAVPAVPLDLVAILVGVAAADAALLALPSPSMAVRAVAGTPLLFLFPGYAVVSSLFPRGRDGDVAGRTFDGVRRPIPGGRPPSTTERLALGFGLSVAALPIVGIALGQTTGFGLRETIFALSAVVVVGSVVGAVRRLRVSTGERYRFPFRTWLAAGWRGIAGADSVTLAAARLVVAVLAVTSMAGLGYAVVAAGSGAGYTDLLLLTRSDGEYVAGDYPRELRTGEPTSLTARIENQEGKPVEYTVVAQLQTVERSDGSVTVTERTEVARATRTLEDGDVWLYDHDISADDPGDDRRLTYLLYRGDPPAEPTVSSAYRDAHLWVDVVEGGN